MSEQSKRDGSAWNDCVKAEVRDGLYAQVPMEVQRSTDLAHDLVDIFGFNRDALKGAITAELQAEYKRVRRETAQRCAEIAETHRRETLAQARHQGWGSCEHPDCSEQRSMSKTALHIGKEISREFGLEQHAETPPIENV